LHEVHADGSAMPARRRRRSYLELLKRAGAGWMNDRAASMGAALAYYSAFSLAPLLIIVIALAGLIFGVDTARRAVVAQFADLVGPVGAGAIEYLLGAASTFGSGAIAAAASGVALLIGATTVLVELQDDLDRIWKAPPRKDGALLAFVRVRLCSFGLILGFGFLLLVSLIVAASIAALSQRWQIDDARLMFAADFALAIAAFTVLFAMLFKWLPNVPMRWSDVWAGAATTALLFNLGRLAIGFYLGQAMTSSAYAAAGSILALLLWLYYSAQIFLFGAEITAAWARHPEPDAPTAQAHAAGATRWRRHRAAIPH
jgi:membrane protein